MKFRIQYWIFFQLIVLFQLLNVFPITNGSKKVLTIAGIQPIHDLFLKAGKLAIADINQRNDILPDYNLTMDIWDSQYDPWIAMRGFIYAVNSGPTKIAVFGAALSSTTETVAAMTNFWNLVTISPLASSAALSDRKKYPSFFTAQATDVTLNPIRIAMLLHYNWTQIAILYNSNSFHRVAAKIFVEDAIKANITTIASEQFITNSVTQLRSIKEKGAKIILVFASSWDLIDVFCEAYYQRLYGPHYVWFTSFGRYKNWWKFEYSFSRRNCTLNQIEEVLGASFVLTETDLGTDGNTVSGMNKSQFLQHYNKFYNRTLNFYHRDFRPQSYDAMWALAIALNKTENILKQNGTSLSDFNYNNSYIKKLLFNEMTKINFTGISGPFLFQSGSRISNIEIRQHQVRENTSNFVSVGIYRGLTNELVINEKKIYWMGNHIPSDQVVTKHLVTGVSKSMFHVISGLSLIGILLTVFFLVMNIKKRKHRHIKMSSPNINNLFLLGCTICYFASVMFGLNPAFNKNSISFTTICSLRVWLLSIGFSIAFGSLLSKTWRAYRIFTNGRKFRVVIKDRQLILTVIILILIDIIYLAIWEAVDPLIGKRILIRTEDAIDQSNTITYIYTTICNSTHNSIWLGILYGMKFLLLLFGTFLAWETRHITIDALNDSRYIGMSIYNITLLCVIGIIISQFLGKQVDAGFAVVAGFILFGTAITEHLVFIPKMLLLQKGTGTVADHHSTRRTREDTNDSIPITACGQSEVGDFVHRINNNAVALDIVRKIITEHKLPGAFVEDYTLHSA